MFSSPRLDWPIERLALTARVPGGALGEHDKMVAAATGSEILLWALQVEGGGSEIGMAFLELFQNLLPVELPELCNLFLPTVLKLQRILWSMGSLPYLLPPLPPPEGSGIPATHVPFPSLAKGSELAE